MLPGCKQAACVATVRVASVVTGPWAMRNGATMTAVGGDVPRLVAGHALAVAAYRLRHAPLATLPVVSAVCRAALAG